MNSEISREANCNRKREFYELKFYFLLCININIKNNSVQILPNFVFIHFISKRIAGSCEIEADVNSKKNLLRQDDVLTTSASVIIVPGRFAAK